MFAHRTGGFGVVVLTNSDNGWELSDAVMRVIGEREGGRASRRADRRRDGWTEGGECA
jgi:hypothetical protein